MKDGQRQVGTVEGARCPFVLRTRLDSGYSSVAFCRGTPNCRPMIPSVEEYRKWCSMEEHVCCPIFRFRLGEAGVEPWLKAQDIELDRWP
jgi:hypothetical protein